MAKIKDLTGKKFNMLTVIEQAGHQKQYVTWLCKCDCGNMKVVKGSHLTLNKVKSCGCLLHKIQNKYYYENRRLYTIYHDMKNRCYNNNFVGYKYYGEKDISICDEWLNDSIVFFEWALTNGYSEKLTIDRINVNGNYEPTNCRWATTKVQMNNTNRNRVLTHNGESMTMAEWADKLKMKYYTFERDINLKNKSIEEIIKFHTEPIHRRDSKNRTAKSLKKI